MSPKYRKMKQSRAMNKKAKQAIKAKTDIAAEMATMVRSGEADFSAWTFLPGFN